MRVALLSDLHGNALALEAVLADVARRGADRLVCLGDVATLGPRPEEVLHRLQGLGCACLLGNHDAFLLDPELIHQYTEAPPVVASVQATRDRLAGSFDAFLRTFVPTLELELGGGQRLGLYHGSPRSNIEDVLVTTPPDQLDDLLRGLSADVYAGGHTHLQMTRQHRGALVVNPGSVGLPFLESAAGGPPRVLPYAEYAIVEGSSNGLSVELRRVPLDRAALRGQLAGWDDPLAGYLLGQYAQ